jgi:5-methylcytosine-specific restriction protein A
MSSSRLGDAHRSLVDGIAALRAASDSSADPDTRKAALAVCESLTRQLEQLSLELIAGLDVDGTFAERGYTRPGFAVADLLGCDNAVAVRRVKVAEQVVERRTLDGQVCPPRLAATAAALAAGEVSLRHVEVITDALATPAAGRLTPHVWAGVEEQLAKSATLYRPRELAGFALELIDTLDQDGAEPDDQELPQLNELHFSRNAAGAGGRIKGVLDAPTFDALATALSALTRPTTGDLRSVGERQADALGEICRHTLDHGLTPAVGGERPHLNITVSLSELEGRGRGATLDTGPLSPSELRRLACDARVMPVVLGGNGQPLDVGRAMRTVPAHLRRAVVVRDHGCAFPGCGREPGWCDAHHIVPWEHGGPTEIGNLVMLCRFHHRLLHQPGWIVRIHDGHPEFVPPKWIDIHQVPRRRPPPNPQTGHSRTLVAVG